MLLLKMRFFLQHNPLTLPQPIPQRPTLNHVLHSPYELQNVNINYANSFQFYFAILMLYYSYLDVIGTCAFGFESNCIQDETAEFERKLASASMLRNPISLSSNKIKLYTNIT